MYSFDDYYYFYLVVKHNGFSAASEASGITKSKLNRRILDLEELFNITLIQRSTRHFKVTALGQEFFEACKKIIHQTDDAKSILTKQGVEPHGLIKVSCPPVMMQYQVHRLLAQFLKKYPKLQLKINLTSQRIDVLQDDVDLAIRTNFFENKDSSIIVRDVIRTTHCLVASPELIKKNILYVTDLSEYPHIVLGTKEEQPSWYLHNLKEKEEIEILLNPRVRSDELMAVYLAAIDGLGIAELPYLVVKNDLQSGKLVHLLPDWCSNVGTVQLVYASRNGNQVTIDLLIEYIINEMRGYNDINQGYIL